MSISALYFELKITERNFRPKLTTAKGFEIGKMKCKLLLSEACEVLYREFKISSK